MFHGKSLGYNTDTMGYIISIILYYYKQICEFGDIGNIKGQQSSHMILTFLPLHLIRHRGGFARVMRYQCK